MDWAALAGSLHVWGLAIAGLPVSALAVMIEKRNTRRASCRCLCSHRGSQHPRRLLRRRAPCARCCCFGLRPVRAHRSRPPRGTP